MPSAFVDQQTKFVATTIALEEDLAGAGSSDSDLLAYFDRHRSEFDTVCVTVASYSSQSDAKAAAAQVAAGTPFPQLAQQAQGEQGCLNLFQLSAQFPASAGLGSLPVGALSAPLQVSNGYVLVQMMSRNRTDYSAARQFVPEAAQEAGATHPGCLGGRRGPTPRRRVGRPALRRVGAELGPGVHAVRPRALGRLEPGRQFSRPR